MAYASNSNPFGFMITPWVKRLLIANGVMFLVTWAFSAGFSGLFEYAAFLPSAVLTRPWTLVTYMFVHAGPMHVIFNMLSLFFFGPVLEERWGGKEFLKFYLLCGLGGALAACIFPNTPIVGASAAIIGSSDDAVAGSDEISAAMVGASDDAGAASEIVATTDSSDEAAAASDEAAASDAAISADMLEAAASAAACSDAAFSAAAASAAAASELAFSAAASDAAA